VAADVLNYLGDLEPFFQALPNCLQAGGLLLFSIEEGAEKGFSLQVSGRYAHAPQYVRALAARSNFRLISERRTGLRRERDRWLAGRLYLLQLAD
jgi:predicted TPR repeat methyltransferase